ncbi:integrase core domain protein-like protein, partial [Leptotrombidium deliense]
MQWEDSECVAIINVLLQQPRTKTEKKLHQQFSLIDGVLCSTAEVNGRPRKRLVIPKKMRPFVLEIVHDNNGHGDFRRTFGKLSERWYWYGYRIECKNYVETCEICQRMNRKTTKAEGLMTSRRIPKLPFEVVSVDHFGPLEVNEGFKYVIILIDHNTRYIVAKPQKSTKSKEFLRFIEEEVVTKFGAPQVLISDRGTYFVSKEAFTYLVSNGIKHLTSPAYFPESNGLAERAVQTMKNTLRKMLDGKQNWKREINKAVFNVNTSINSSTGVSPFELMFGYKPRIQEESIIGTVMESENRIYQMEKLKELRRNALQSMEEAHKRQATYYNENRKETSF